MTGTVSRRLALLLLVVLAITTAGCAVAGGIFKAGFWIGVVIAVVIVVTLLMLFRRA